MTAGNKNHGTDKGTSSGKTDRSNGGHFANDREKASEAGRKGGQSGHSGGRKS
ncbi:general stress protein [Pseudomonas sp. Q11]|nr:KGG domain-containing protein [Pseudomonas sp. Q11]MCQ6255544.1 general stress protein [Pseudomonas sp. Q11]